MCVCVCLEKHLKQTNKDGSLIYMFFYITLLILHKIIRKNSKAVHNFDENY